MTLAPGGQSALRHWHTLEDEFVYVLEGEVVLVTDAGEQSCAPAIAPGYPAGKARRASSRQPQRRAGALSRNRQSRRGRYARFYPDDDLKYADAAAAYAHKDGRPY